MSRTDERLQETDGEGHGLDSEDRGLDSEVLQDLDSEVVGDDLHGDVERDRSSATRRGGRLVGLRRRIGGVFSPRGFLLALALTLGAFLAASAVVPFVGGIAGLIGVFAAGFVLGVLGRRGYLELFVAGAATAGVGLLLDQLVLSVVGGFALPLTAVGAAAGAVAAVVGHYFGRDLREGLTRSL
jgi:hypothetical protein